MNLTKTRWSLQEIIQNWKDQIICFSPKGEGYSAYLVDSKSEQLVNYIQANCDELRHLATNYDLLLVKIKNEHEGYLKEAILNTIKYEATRRAFKKQHEWIQNSYQTIIDQKKLTAEQQQAEIKKLKQIIADQKQEVATIKTQCRDEIVAIKSEILLQKEAIITQQNLEIAKLKAQLELSDRQIQSLQTELHQGLQTLQLKYKWLIAQFIQEQTARQKIAQNNKSLQTCQRLFKKAQQKINLLQCQNKLLEQDNIHLQRRIKLLRV
ncbi:hypothetical protein NIES4102_18570 [Chondrocystis sp. NIES-4102]|nr:hypothetical protein NIES4102_18570 [Chondrocystis sp. NIES-4102]